MLVAILILILNLSFLNGEKLPDYFKICNRNDPDLNDCIIKASKSVVPLLVKGIDYLNVPELSPLKVPEIDLDQDDNLNLKLINVTVHGLESANLVKVDANLTKRIVKTEIHFDEILFESAYEVKGRIIILPIHGDGTAQIKFDDVLVKFSFDYDLIENNGEKYLNFTQVDLKYSLKKASYKLDNLFNGDKFLGDQMNKFINENWDTLHNDFAPIISETIKNIIVDILKDVVKLIPYQNIFSGIAKEK